MKASDPDIPLQTLAFSLDPGAPDGASINPSTGGFTWTPTESQGPGIYPITVRVTDDGVPPLSNQETVILTVIEPPRPANLAAIEVDDGQFQFTFSAQPGKTYLVQAKDNVADPVWVFVRRITSGQAVAVFNEPINASGTRYYRVITEE